MRRAKIVCTLGPATSTEESILALVEAGMDVARLNLSHGSHADHEANYAHVRSASDTVGRAVGILADLQGPKIRTGRFADGPVTLEAGETFTITTRDISGSSAEVGTTYDGLPGDVRPGDRLLVDDGKLSFVATEVTETDVVCEVVEGGELSNNKGINLPGVAVSVPALSEKDKEDLRFALRMHVDFVALSFVRSARDMDDVRAIMDEVGITVPVIAKIEKPQAVDNLEEIIEAFDGLMVARGDLGVELPLEQVPLVQKKAVEQCRRHGKPVIVATQVLESMVTNSRPTRAEASDAANAVLDGADAIMLSGETSVGSYPTETVRTMAEIITHTEEQGLDRIAPLRTPPVSIGGAIAAAGASIASLIGVRYICTFTQTGESARRMAQFRHPIPILAFTPLQATRSQLALTWGVETFLTPTPRHTDDYAKTIDRLLLADGRIAEGERVVIVAGSPPGIPGSTNALRVHRAGDAAKGAAPAYVS
ncbi:pyruvate kinase [Nostocoides sp. F2B08]|uniref:pyruvate kinase n=1 Tax=Nostocoides sp. F2B08 TaxID=2653936 RepID=UPI001262C2ED|nr:pyruvate kinase [Tetrasphaera sp. F2B08]KAB7744572.1 pyruvate kinase [Tetrasphaera sp. F2B08]